MVSQGYPRARQKENGYPSAAPPKAPYAATQYAPAQPAGPFAALQSAGSAVDVSFATSSVDEKAVEEAVHQLLKDVEARNVIPLVSIRCTVVCP